MRRLKIAVGYLACSTVVCVGIGKVLARRSADYPVVGLQSEEAERDER